MKSIRFLKQLAREDGSIFLLGSFIFFIILAVIIVAGIIIYDTQNIDPLGAKHQFYQSLQISESNTQISDEYGNIWTVEYENNDTISFSGLVRHINPDRMSTFSVISHDILVTTGDFANPDIVSTRVFEHQFQWVSRIEQSPVGTINLLHTIPINEEIFDGLLEIRTGDFVKLSGREIFRLDSIDVNGNIQASWKDAGCNTILITKIEIIKE